jgi:hypothetical protein
MGRRDPVVPLGRLGLLGLPAWLELMEWSVRLALSKHFDAQGRE